MRHNPADPHWAGRDRFVLSCGTLQPHPLHPALPRRLGPRARRPQGAAHLGLARPRATPSTATPPASRPPPVRSARASATRSAWPWRPAASAACSTPTPPRATRRSTTTIYAHLLRRRHRGGRERRGLLHRRHPAARQPHRHLRRQPDLDRGRHRHRAHRGRRRPLRGLRLARADRRLDPRRHATTPRTSRRCTPPSARRRARSPTGPASSCCARSSPGPRPTLQNTGKSPRLRPRRRRRSPPPRRSSASTPSRHFEVPADVIEHTREAVARGKAAAGRVGRATSPAGRRSRPPTAALFDRMQTRTLPDGWADALPVFDADEKGVATRVASGKAINAIAPARCPSCGAARPTWPAPTTPPSRASRRSCPRTAPPRCVTGDPLAGRVLHFGIREHGMGAIMNGIAVHGGTRVFGGTFLTFSDYMRPVGAAGRAHAAAGDLRLDARLHRPRRGRPDPPADRAPRRPARHPRPRRRTPGGRQRDRRRVEDRPRAQRPPRRPVPDPPERPDLPARRGRLRRHVQRAPWRLRPRSTPTASPTSSSSAPGPRCSWPSGRASSSPPTASPRASSRCRASSGSTRRTRPTARR